MLLMLVCINVENFNFADEKTNSNRAPPYIATTR